MIKSFQCVVTGKVQGGNLHGWTQEQAEELGLCGWVRNVADGKVEVLLQGDDSKVDEFMTRLKTKAPIPRLDKIKSQWIDYDKKHDVFEMRN